MPDRPAAPRLERALDLLFPPVCVGCRRSVGTWICPACWMRAAWICSTVCPACGVHPASNPCPDCGYTAPLQSLYAVMRFEGIGREAVHTFKFNGLHGISGLMSRLMAETVRGVRVDAIVPVPLHLSRRRQRGFDQSVMLAQKMGRSLSVPYTPLLRRTRPTSQQALLGAAERPQNVKGAFAATGEAPAAVLLIDDVATTGATIGEAARVLRAAGAEQVIGAVFARA